MSQTNGLSHNGGSVMSQDYMYNQGNQNRMMSGELASGGNQPRMFSGEVGPGGMGGMLTGQSSNAWQVDSSPAAKFRLLHLRSKCHLHLPFLSIKNSI